MRAAALTLPLPLAFALLAGCSPPPEAARDLPPPTEGTAYPDLLPQREIAAVRTAVDPADAAANAALIARADALRRRAAAL